MIYESKFRKSILAGGDMMLDCFPVAQCGVGMGMVKVLQLENFILNLGNSSSVKLLERG